ncbi:maleylacetoacetate isomerase, partial [Pseudomonas sp. MWU13-2860]
AAAPGRYAAGEQPTLADVCLLPQVFSAHHFGLDLTAYPHIVRVADALEQVPAFAAAHPSLQPDAI